MVTTLKQTEPPGRSLRLAVVFAYRRGRRHMGIEIPDSSKHLGFSKEKLEINLGILK